MEFCGKEHPRAVQGEAFELLTGDLGLSVLLEE
jgi:hypothetical protein